MNWKIFAFCFTVTLCFYVPAIFIATQSHFRFKIPLAILIASLGVMLGMAIYAKKVEKSKKNGR